MLAGQSVSCVPQIVPSSNNLDEGGNREMEGKTQKQNILQNQRLQNCMTRCVLCPRHWGPNKHEGSMRGQRWRWLMSGAQLTSTSGQSWREATRTCRDEALSGLAEPGQAKGARLWSHPQSWEFKNLGRCFQSGLTKRNRTDNFYIPVSSSQKGG